jgi:hypothetical protein
MSVGYPFVQLQQLACQAIAINTAAGGAVAFSDIGGPIPALQTIYCQLAAATVAQGGAAAGAGNFQNIPGLQALILCQVQALAAATGTASAVPADPYSALSAWNAIDCALAQILINVSGPRPDPPENLFVSFTGPDMLHLDWDPPAGPSPDSFNIYRSLIDGGPYTLLTNVPGIDVSYEDFAVSDHKTYYYVLRSVTGGIESVDSNQASGVPQTELDIFTSNLLAYAPDALFIGDTIVANPGDPVNSWADSSGNGRDATVPGGNPTISILTPNGRQSVKFNGTTAYLEIPLPNTGSTSSAIAVVNLHNLPSTDGRVVTASKTGSVDYDAAGFVHGYLPGSLIRAYHNGSICDTPTVTADIFQIFSSIADGANCRVKIGADNVSGSYVDTPFAIDVYALGGWPLAGSVYLNYDIPFCFIKKAALSAPDEASIIALVNTYYGL